MAKGNETQAAVQNVYTAEIIKIVQELKSLYALYNQILIEAHVTDEELPEEAKPLVKNTASSITQYVILAEIEYETLKTIGKVKESKELEKHITDIKTKQEKEKQYFPMRTTVQKIIIELNKIIIQEIAPAMYQDINKIYG